MNGMSELEWLKFMLGLFEANIKEQKQIYDYLVTCISDYQNEKDIAFGRKAAYEHVCEYIKDRINVLENFEHRKESKIEVKKYRKKPVVISAYQTDVAFDIETLEGTMRASVGDYIITGVDGEQYPCKPDIFKKTYEEVLDEMD